MLLGDIDKVIYYSQRCCRFEIIRKLKLDVEKDDLIIKKIRNNLGRFW
jgi:hypothetical protein